MHTSSVIDSLQLSMALLDSIDAILGSIFVVLVRAIWTYEYELGSILGRILGCFIVAKHTIEYITIFLTTVFKTKTVREKKCGVFHKNH